MYSVLCLTLSSAILFFILRYRVHIHVTYTAEPTPQSRGSRRRPRTGDHSPQTQRNGNGRRLPMRSRDADSDVSAMAGAPAREIESALRNLGAKPATARAAAAKAIQQTNDFDEALKLAIQYATTKEAA